MAGLTRLELATFRVTGERSNQTELQPQIFWDKIRLSLPQQKSLVKLLRTIKCQKKEKPPLVVAAPYEALRVVWLLGQDSNLRPND